MTLLVPLLPPEVFDELSELQLGYGEALTTDLSGFEDDDAISIALPDFPLNSLTLADSYIDFTSEPDGNFAAGPTVSISFDESIVTLIEGDSEFRFLIGTLRTRTDLYLGQRIDLSAITGIRFRIEATADCLFRCAAIRALDTNWLHAPLDQSTIRDYIVRPVSLTGDVGVVPSFPVDGQSWPLLVRSDEPSSAADPTPVDATLNIGFNTGSMYAASGDASGAYDFDDAASSYIEVSNDATLNPTTAITLEAWVRPGTVSGTDPIVAKNGQYKLEVVNGTIVFTLTIAATEEDLVTVDTIDTNEWSHIVATYDGADQRIYINGSESISVGQTGTIDTSGSTFRIGHQASTANYFDGVMDEVAVYGSALDAEKIEEHYETALGASGVYPELVLDDSPGGYWRLGEDSTDSSGNGNDGTENGTITAADGVLATDNVNQISVFLRETAIDSNTQLDLNGIPVSQLEGTDPSFGPAKFQPRTQADIDQSEDTIPGEGFESGASGLDQDDMDGISQFSLERTIDQFDATYIEVRLIWSSSGATVSIRDAENPLPYYSFDIDTNTATTAVDKSTLYAQNDYALVVDIRERQIRVKILALDLARIIHTVFDSTIIEDYEAIKRSKGRIGWYARLLDGDAFLKHFYPQHMNFAEYRSLPFRSTSPVTGAQLTVGGNVARKDYFKGIFKGPWGGQLFDFPERGPEAFKIRNAATLPLQGIQSNEVFLDDFEHWEIQFSLLVSQRALDAGSIEAFLWDSRQAIEIPIGDIKGGAWHPIRVRLSDIAPDFIPGTYRLVLVQSTIGTPNDWYVDAISFLRDTMKWEGRAFNTPNPWIDPDNWISFRSAINDPNHGVLFTERGRTLEIRGQALRQPAQISQLRIEPKYAELGRLVWEDQELVQLPIELPTSDFDYSVSDKTVAFSSTSTDPNGRIISHSWSFGDGGRDTGASVSHTYERAGTYPVTLIVVDNNGDTDSLTQNVVVA